MISIVRESMAKYFVSKLMVVMIELIIFIPIEVLANKLASSSFPPSLLPIPLPNSSNLFFFFFAKTNPSNLDNSQRSQFHNPILQILIELHCAHLEKKKNPTIEEQVEYMECTFQKFAHYMKINVSPNQPRFVEWCVRFCTTKYLSKDLSACLMGCHSAFYNKHWDVNCHIYTSCKTPRQFSIW